MKTVFSNINEQFFTTAFMKNAVSEHYRGDESVAFPNLCSISLICFPVSCHASHFTYSSSS